MRGLWGKDFQKGSLTNGVEGSSDVCGGSKEISGLVIAQKGSTKWFKHRRTSGLLRKASAVTKASNG